MKSYIISRVFEVKPDVLYKLWLDEVFHRRITGTHAHINPEINGKFTKCGGYITGTIIDLVADKKIVLKWRTTDFLTDIPDSIIEITFNKFKTGTKLIIRHSEVPEKFAANYRQAWVDYYFKPMVKYFSKELALLG